ncbi:MAG: peptidase inhibitor family I36 protein [Proteobacteria bacterium]|nr:peptidase inhibitor family I36 protein [Pseudomonadota bacterium]
MKKSLIQLSAAAALAVVALQASADVTFYEHENYEGRSFTAQGPVGDFRRFGFNDQASSVVVTGSAWEVCGDRNFGGPCAILRPGNYPSLRAMNLNDRISSARATDHDRHYDQGRYAPQPMAGQITFYSQQGFQGRNFAAEGDVPDFSQYGFNDRASSVIVLGNERWEACENANFNGRCVILRPGRYSDLSAMGLNNAVSSVRLAHPGMRYEESRYAPPPAPAYDWRRRHDERVYEVNVSAVHAVYATPQQRCWVERQQVVQDGRNVGGAVVGGIVGGILGHQIGGGTGKALATVGGAVAGAAIGANVDRGPTTAYSQDVQRCAEVPRNGQPDYWDVTYYFRSAEHHVQMAAPPGPTIQVNEAGEPRV